MAEMTLHIDIVSAEREIFSGRAETVFATADFGELGIKPGHSQLLASLEPGQIRLALPDGLEEVFYVSGGFLEVQPHLVTVLADTAERAKDLDEARATEAMNKAKQLLADKQADIDYAKTLTELAQAVAQLRAIHALRGLRN